MEFCSPFDEALARTGAAAVFLRDPEGLLRFDPTWSRDAWGRAPGPHQPGHTWMLARDRDTGFVFLVLVTSPTLLVEHPRLDLRVFGDLQAAQAELVHLGSPALAPQPW